MATVCQCRKSQQNCQLRVLHALAKEASWFEKDYPQANLEKVAYFSMEFGLSEALPIYSGGLGKE